MMWNYFIYFALPSLAFWVIAAYIALRNQYKAFVYISTLVGIIIYSVFIILLWHSLERPPMRTMGETRLWYAFFLPVIGWIVYLNSHYRWILSFSTFMAAVFIFINLLHPESHNKTLMPALQSPWFIPHVSIYMFAYALLGIAAILAIYLLFIEKSNVDNKALVLSDSLVRMGLGFLSIGMLTGALWAKEAWGDYWSWDPKEIWAAATWMGYLSYIHYRLLHPNSVKTPLYFSLISFLLLQMCWYGINYLPTVKGTSVHLYGG